MTQIKPKPCKNCGVLPRILRVEMGVDIGTFGVYCPSCYYSTRNYRRKNLAIHVWNKENGTGK